MVSIFFTRVPLFNEIRVGKWLPVRPNTNITGNVVDWYYFLTNGIYLRYRIFVQTVADARTRKEKLFCAQQEGVRKAVERILWRVV